MTELIVTVMAALFVSFLCSIMEAVLLSIRMATLVELRDGGSRGAALLLDLKQHKLDDAISAILTLNTIAHTIGAALAGAQAAKIFGDAWVGAFSAALTLLILVVTEIIPKTVGAVYARQLSGLMGYINHYLALAMTPLLFLTRSITKLIARDRTVVITAGELSAMVSMAADQGALSEEQSALLNNLLREDALNIADVMTPRAVLVMMPAKMTLDAFMKREEIGAFSRIPVFGETYDEVQGYVLAREVFAFLAAGGDRGRILEQFKRPICVLPKTYSVGDALRAMTAKREHLAIVLDEYGGVSGLVTLEDLFETLLGVEIVDESDRVTDLRKVAMNIRDQRLARLEKKRHPDSPYPQPNPPDEGK